jgi:hypothetical protein
MLTRNARAHVGIVGRCAQIAAKYGEKRDTMEPFRVQRRAALQKYGEKRNAMEPFRVHARSGFKMN